MLKYQDQHMRADLSASKRIQPQHIMDARLKLIKMHKNKEQGWLDILSDKKYTAGVLTEVKHFSKYKNLLVIGIGGSDLGAQAIIRALGQKKNKTKVWFAGNTTDPDAIAEVFAKIPWKETAINVVSKSGSTLEPLSVFFEAKSHLERAEGAKKSAKAIICTTDPEQGALLNLARENGYAVLPIPQNIGGRFSVLTAVGLFPAAMAGINITKILAAASKFRDSWLNYGGTSHIADQYAAHHAAHLAEGRNLHVLFSYCAALKEFTEWYRQIWAESLGKRSEAAPTPIAAMGPTDQHSQLQLYQDGPDDKVYTFVKNEKFNNKIRVPKTITDIGHLAYAKNHTFAELNHAALTGTYNALQVQNKPVGILSFNRLDEEAVGELIVFYEIATAISGILLNINPFDQPGVEDSKRRVKELLES